MSGSFWKYNQEYSVESNVTKLLHNAFKLKETGEIINSDTDINELFRNNKNDKNYIKNDNSNDKINDNDDDDTSDDIFDYESVDDFLNNEDSFDKLEPNLDILNDLVDDEELYTELMCSNFKLLMYLKYPVVLDKLIDFITNDKFLQESKEIETINLNTSTTDDLNQQIILVDSKDNDGNDSKDNDETSNDLKNRKDVDIIIKIDNYEDDNNDIDNELKNNKIVGNQDNDEDIEEKLKLDNDSNSDISEETSITIPPESEEQVDSRRARMATEILSADIWQISSTIVENNDLLIKLWSILKENENDLSITVSTYFMKINQRLLDTNMLKMIEFISNKDNLVDKFLKHIDNPSLMDFLLKVISTDKSDSTTGIIKYLFERDFIIKLINLLDSDKYNNSIQSAAADFIKAFVTLSANSNNEISIGIGPNELTRQLVSHEITEKLIKIMLKGGTALSNGVGIIIELIRKNNSDYDFIQVMYTNLETHPPNDRDPIHLTYLIKLFAQYMPDFFKLLERRIDKPLQTTFGEIEPLGFERFKICELVAELLHCSNMTLLNEKIGEKITKQRDLVRKHDLYGDYMTLDELEQLNIELQKLAISNKDSKKSKITNNCDDSVDYETNGNNRANQDDENNSIENGTINNDEEDFENSLEIYPNDEIENSSDLETKLKNDKIPGDLLKISLIETSMLRYIVEMFFQFEWNNFLHNVVFDIIQQVFNGPLKSGYNRFLLSDLLTNARLTDKIIEGNDKCVINEEKNDIRLGYMGHLTLIAEEVAKFVEYIDEMRVTFTHDGILNVINEPEWQEFMNTTLAETRDKYNAVLGDFILEDEEEDEMENSQSSEDLNGSNNLYSNTHDEDEDDYDYYQDGSIQYSNDLGNGVSDEPKYEYEDDERHESINKDLDDEDNINDDYYEYEDPSGHKTFLKLNNEDLPDQETHYRNELTNENENENDIRDLYNQNMNSNVYHEDDHYDDDDNIYDARDNYIKPNRDEVSDLNDKDEDLEKEDEIEDEEDDASLSLCRSSNLNNA